MSNILDDYIFVWNKTTVKIKSQDESISEYYYSNTPELISRSGLDTFEKGPEFYEAMLDRNKKNLLDPVEEDETKETGKGLGTKTHHKLLEPEQFSKLYYQLDENHPENLAGDYVKTIKQHILTTSNNVPVAFLIEQDWDNILTASYELYKASVEKTRYEKQETFTAKVSPYKNYIINWANNYYKTPISAGEVYRLNKIEESVRNHWKAKELIFPHEFIDPDISFDVYTEKMIIWAPDNNAEYTYEYLAKSLLDRVLYFHTKENPKSIIVDLKTTSEKLNNNKAVIEVIKKWRYDRQMSFYFDALKYHNQAHELDNYDIEVYLVMVETSFPFRTRVVQFRAPELYNARKEYRKLYYDLQWHLDNGIWVDRSQLNKEDLIDFQQV